MPRPKSRNTIDAEQIAAKSGLTPKYLLDLHRTQGMPLTPIEAGLQWLENRPDADHADDSDCSTSALRRERIRVLRLQGERLEHALDVERGLYISREFADDHAGRIGAAIGGAMQKLARELPPLLLGLPLARSLPITRAEVIKIQKMLSDEQSEFWKSLPLKNN